MDVALHGDPRPIDVGEMNGTFFAVMAGAGFDAMMIREADESALKEQFGRFGYVVAGFGHRQVSPAVVRIELDGAPWYHGTASCVIVGNVSTILGGLEAFPGASPTDGRLEVGVVDARSATDWLRVLASATVRTRRQVAAHQGLECTGHLDPLRPHSALGVVGGDRDRASDFDIRCVPRGVRICQPRVDAPETAGTPR